MLAHAFVAGAEPSDSERDISVGGVSIVPTSVFDGIDYAALGHLHGRHTLTDSIRYSGSPLAYSFSEADHRKGSWLVELDATAWPGRVRRGAGPRAAGPAPRHARGPARRPAPRRHEGAWVQATLTDDSRPVQAMDRLRGRFPHTLVLGFEPAHGDRSAVPAARPKGRSDHEIALDFVAEMRAHPPPTPRRRCCARPSTPAARTPTSTCSWPRRTVSP